ncbi:LCP family protein [Embleya sp. NBC_00888]|uniref:LCP family protein n=1 Tax=Embleya sp. NBC_00888 TaxID=2975960 RepID=UPI00386CBC08|nr:LCP family protein [Embleya sp. NBC_00888]
MSNDDRREWEPYGTEQGDGGQAQEPYGTERGDGGQVQGQQPGYGSYAPDGGFTGYDPQPPAAPGSSPQGLEPVYFAPQQQYPYDPNAYDPNAYPPGTYSTGGYESTGYDPNAYDPGTGAGTYDPNGYGTGGAGQGGYDANAYDPNAYDPNGYDPTGRPAEAYPPQDGRGGFADPQQGYYEQQQPTAYYEQPAAPPAPPAPPVVPGSRPAPAPGPAAPLPSAGTDPASTGIAAGSIPVRPARPARSRSEATGAAAAAPSSTPTSSASTSAERGSGSGRSAASTDDGRVPPPRTRKPGPGRPGRPGYGSDEFAFVDDESEQAEDVIDWLSFAETRSERRDEKRRAIRQRLIALAVVLAVALLGVGGYFAWDTWMRDEKSVAAPGKNGGVLVQLRAKDGKAAANVLLTVDPAKNTASMVSVSSVTIVNSDNSSFPLGQLMADEGPGASRDALSDLLGVRLDGSWVISEPVLQGLVDLAGGIQLNADVEIKGPDGKVLVGQGRNPANGVAALAFAGYKQPNEAPAVVGDRFGRVLQGLLAAFPTQPDAVLSLLANMANVPDPSLPDDKLSVLLANLAKATQAKQMQVRALPVSADGILDTAAALPIVRELLGGTVRQGKVEAGPARVMVEDASGKPASGPDAQARLLNAGVTYVPGGASGKRTQPTSTVQYADDARKADAEQVALTLALPATAVKKATGEMLADVVVTLGQDYNPEKP